MKYILDKIIKGTFYAVRGAWYGFYSRRNLSLFLIITLLVVSLLILLGTTKVKFAIIFSCWVAAIIVEILNSAVEKFIDIYHPNFHEGLGKVKDMLAGAVFLTIVNAIIVTVILLWDPVMEKIFGA